ncbi:DUF6705 family protein [Chryseobacterium sp. Bi04]|uniref:DUF6705 family protein n=1 Tax=Chryseobacterium sp. Bi04 TaxID=2822345 RepID=UPI001DBBFF9B|nr:DUF6705 family protein [Chryseobacterium sp. Bi04]CAH0239716.1 hypothetical protein SRABI04_02947 [Chryseobacterium sp. Bi04]
MKKIIIIFLLFCINFINAQQTLPLNTPKIDIPNGAYYKDLDGELDPYVGAWKGTWDGKTLYLELKKIKKRYMSNDGTYYDSDKIVGERKLVSSNGTIEIDRISNFDQNAPEFYGIYPTRKPLGQKSLFFQPKNMCNKTADLIIIFTNSQKTQISLELIENPVTISDITCPNYNQLVEPGKGWRFNFPKDIVLTKQ